MASFGRILREHHFVRKHTMAGNLHKVKSKSLGHLKKNICNKNNTGFIWKEPEL